MKLERFHIAEFTNPSGVTVFRVDGKDKDGKRIRKNFRTLAEAKAEKQVLEGEIENLPHVPMVASWLTPEQAREAEQAFKELDGKPLLRAVRFFNENFREPVAEIEIRAAFEKFMADKAAQNLRPDSLTNLRVKVNMLVRLHEGKNVSAILPEHVKEVAFKPGLSPVSANNIRRAIYGFFSWAVENGFAKENPVEKIKVAEVDDGEPEILPLADARQFIESAAALKDGVLVPYIALGLFCAVRPQEMARLTWDDIDLKHGTITISGKIAKMRGRRVVEIPKNAVKWLLPHSAKRTPFKGQNWRRDFDRLKELCGYSGRSKEGNELKPWVPDILRHTAISYHLAKHEHEGKTATWAGNSPDIIQKHYRALVQKKADVRAFWAIEPSDAAKKIVRLPKAA